MTHKSSNDPRRIVHVAAHYPPSLGGLERVVQSLAEHQSERGLDVEVMTSSVGRASPGPAYAPSGPGYVRRFRSVNVANTAVMPGLLGALLRLPRRSIIHLHVAQAFIPEAVFFAHVLRGHKYLAHVHIDVGASGPAGFLLRVWKPLILGPILRRADAVVVFTEEQRSVIAAKYRIDPRRIVVIPNGVDVSYFHSEERVLHSKPRLLFVGRLSVQKNLMLLLRALVGVSDAFETSLVGDGGLEQELRRAAHNLGVDVRFHGRADGQELLDFYRQADVFVLPSEREGMPLVLLEALAMGLPIVATDVPGSRDLVEHERNGLLVPLDDPLSLRAALLAVTSDAEKHAAMSERSRQLANRYSWDVIGGEFDRLYSLLSRT